MVWGSGLMFKQNELGINGKLWSLINNCQQNTLGSIIVKQNSTRVQTTRCSTGRCTINVPLSSLQKRSCPFFTVRSPNTGILDIPSSCPSLSDDLSLIIGISPLAIQTLLDTAYKYSCKWRFTMNYRAYIM